MKKYAYATVATNLTYIIGAVRLYQRLQYLQSRYPLLIIITDNVEKQDLEILHSFNIPYTIKPYYRFYFTDKGKYQDTINKFQLFAFTEYEKIIFLDADSLPNVNIDFFFSIKLTKKQYIISFGEKRDGYEELIPQWVKGALFICKPNKEIYDFIFSNQMVRYYYMNDETVLSHLFYNGFTNIQLHDIIEIPHFAGGPLKIWSIKNKDFFFYHLFNEMSALDFNLFFDKYKDELLEASNCFEEYQRINHTLKEKISEIIDER